jgi:porin
MNRCAVFLSAIVLMVMLAAVANAQTGEGESSQGDQNEEREGPPNLGSPDQVDNQMETDAEPKDPLLRFTFLDPYLAWKADLKARTGFGFGVDYSTVYFKANESPNEDRSASGMIRFYGSWELVGRESGNVGAFVYKIEHRHSYTTVAPKFFGFNLGYVGMMAAPFNDDEFRVTNLYWRQRLASKRFVMMGGFLDATDFVDIYGMASPWLHFMNLAFSTGSAAIALPNDALLGLAAGAWINDHMYAIASIGDNGSDPTDPFTGFDRFFNVNEYFTSVEVGWTTAHDRAYFDNIHLVFWHSDQKTEIGDPAGWGVNASGTWFIQNRWMPFLRGGYTEDGGSLLQKSISAGAGYQWIPGRDVLGLALNWGQPNETTWGPDLPDQYTMELFWRWQLGHQLAITPDLQLVIDPANNPDASQIWIFGLRARLAL